MGVKGFIILTSVKPLGHLNVSSKGLFVVFSTCIEQSLKVEMLKENQE